MKRRNLILAAALLPAAAFGRGIPQVLIESRIVETGPGIVSANFGTNFGNVYANFPSDLAPGDKISGTFATAPRGKDDKARAETEIVLRSLRVGICGSNFSVGAPVFVCPRVSDGGIRLVLKFREDDLGNLLLPVSKDAAPAGQGTFLLPTQGLVFNRVLIPGPFDGDLRTTSVRIGDTVAHLVAESPRACVFDAPPTPVGPTRIEFRKGTDELSGTFRNVGLRLKPPRPIIHTGDSTSFEAEVTGLAGLEQPLRLSLKNLSPEIVLMAGGDEQSLTIAPGDVSARGTFAVARDLSGKHRGDYVVNVSIPWRENDFRKQEPGR
ncbi:MAG: hypothetical protein ACRD16_09175 [Thermoanaerobaculia bacterium]